jgi:hypothetical protein
MRLTTTVALLALAGCGGPTTSGNRAAFTSTDSWYSPPPNTAEFAPVEKERYSQVIPGLQSEAQTALSVLPVKRITAEEAARLAGRPLPAGAEYVLLRAVVLNEGTGGFDVGIDGSSVHVHHGCLGRSPAPMTRKALVAVLPSLPRKVFVSCSMDE